MKIDPKILNSTPELFYNDELSPLKNILEFFEKIKVMKYEVITDPEGNEILNSEWKNTVGLKSILSDFSNRFYDELINLNSGALYGETINFDLKPYDNLVNDFKKHFENPFQDVLILKLNANGKFIKVNFDTIAIEFKTIINDCHKLLLYFFDELHLFIKDEIAFQYRVKIGNDKSKYIWNGDKSDLVELIYALITNNSVHTLDGKDLMTTSFARELGLFFNVKDLHYHQTIKSFREREGKDKKFFIDVVKEGLHDKLKSEDK